MKQPKNSLQLPKPTADTRRIQNKLTTLGSGEKHLQIKTILFIIREVIRILAERSLVQLTDTTKKNKPRVD